MLLRQTVVGFIVAFLLALGPTVHAQSAAELAELAAAAAPPGPAPLAPADHGTLTCSVGQVSTTFYVSDFELDDGGWTGGGDAPWEWGAPVLGVHAGCDTTPEDEPAGAASGSNVWATNLDGCYANSGTESLLSQTFDFSSLPAPIQLAWTNWYEVFVPFDMGEVRVNGGAPLFEIATPEPTPDYVHQSVDLSAFAGNPSVTIDFRLFATTVVNRSGWYLDDVAIEYCAAPVPTLGNGAMTSLLLMLLMAVATVLLVRRRHMLG
jgi:hypothetical protein